MRLSHNSDRDRYRRVSVHVIGSIKKRGTFLGWTQDHRRGFVELDPRPGQKPTRYATEGHRINIAHKAREPGWKGAALDRQRPLLAELE